MRHWYHVPALRPSARLGCGEVPRGHAPGEIATARQIPVAIAIFNGFAALRARAKCAPLGPARPRRTSLLTQSFSELGLPAPIVSALTAAGFDTPTPIQAKAIPPQMQRRDIMGIAQTGSGKTAAFGLPILAGIAELKGRAAPLTTRALILAPTRELAVQIDEVLQELGVVI